jgi:hypothetical protein
MLFLSLIFLFLISCSDNLLYNEATPHIFIDVLNRSDTISVGETVRFQARINPSPEDVESFFWIIEAQDPPNYPVFYSELLIEKKFEKSGLYNVKFYTIDQFYDGHEINLFIRVSSKPICDDELNLEYFQGSPIFKWNCYDIDGNSLIYDFLLYDYDNYKILPYAGLTENSLQLGYALPENYTIHLTATNNYGIETRLEWSTP